MVVMVVVICGGHGSGHGCGHLWWSFVVVMVVVMVVIMVVVMVVVMVVIMVVAHTFRLIHVRTRYRDKKGKPLPPDALWSITAKNTD